MQDTKVKLLIAAVVILVVLLGLSIFTRPAAAPTTEEEGASEQVGETETEEAVSEEENETPEESMAVPSTNQQPSTQTRVPTPPPSNPEPAKPQLPMNAIVTYDGGRFLPEEVTIVEGGTVRFVNVSQEEDMWIASANHPSHTIYPIKSESDCKGSSFDQCESVPPGGSWSFTFERFGTWSYHNHMRAKDTGKVEVLRVEEYWNTM